MSRARAAVLVPAVIVGAAAIAATAHGGYEVAVASGVPGGLIGSLYPLITDGLALVAYAATHRLPTPASRAYAWAVVIVAAGLSGLAQAVYLAAGNGLATPSLLRFGVGAWPALAGAVAAHLVYLLVAHHPAATSEPQPGRQPALPSAPAAPTGPPATSRLDDLEVDTRPEMEMEVAVVAETWRPRLVAELVAHQDTSRDDMEDQDMEMEEKVRQIVADGGGRTRVMRELDVTEYKARRLLEAAQPAVNGSRR